jgi:hypothetical protein
VRDLHRTRLAKPAELRWGVCRFKPLGGVAVSSLIATLWLPTSAALVGHRGLFSWPRWVFHGPAVSAWIICPPALYVCVLSRLLSSGFLEQAYRYQTPSIMVPQLWEPLFGVYPPPPDLPMQGPLGFFRASWLSRLTAARAHARHSVPLFGRWAIFQTPLLQSYQRP